MLINELKSAIDNGATLRSLYGTDEAVINQQKIRYAALADEFVKTYGNKDLTVFSSPGRTEIGGNHTDHNHGRVLAGAVNLDNVAVAAPNGTSVVRILSSGYPQFEVDITK